MSEVRLAKRGNILRQKEIWKLCFGDSYHYIDFYFDNMYKEDETLLLFEDESIASMLTMLPVKIITVDQRSFDSAMLYAVATHPNYQNRGFSSQLIDFAHQYLRNKGIVFTVLVPSGKRLFNFYRKQGYEDGLYIRELLFNREMIEQVDKDNNYPCILSRISSEIYNQIRREKLTGKFHVDYSDDKILYQKQLSRESHADLFSINCNGLQGCAAIERLNIDRVFIKELLIPEKLLTGVVNHVAGLLPAREYVVRTPAFSGQQLQGIRPFGMIKAIQKNDFMIATEDFGYLGFAFD